MKLVRLALSVMLVCASTAANSESKTPVDRAKAEERALEWTKKKKADLNVCLTEPCPQPPIPPYVVVFCYIIVEGPCPKGTLGADDSPMARPTRPRGDGPTNMTSKEVAVPTAPARPPPPLPVINCVGISPGKISCN